MGIGDFDHLWGESASLSVPILQDYFDNAIPLEANP